MRALILLDGQASPRVWSEHLEALLLEGSSVFVLDDPIYGSRAERNPEAILSAKGINTSRLQWRNVDIKDIEQVQAITRELEQLPSNVVIMWRAPMWTWPQEVVGAQLSSALQKLLQISLSESHSVIAVARYADGTWIEDVSRFQACALPNGETLKWDYLAGKCLGAALYRHRFREVMGLSVLLEHHWAQLSRAGDSSTWQVACPAFYKEISLEDKAKSDKEITQTLATNKAVYVEPAGLSESLKKLAANPKKPFCYYCVFKIGAYSGMLALLMWLSHYYYKLQ